MICLVRLVQGSRVAYIQQSKFLDLLFAVGQGGNYMYRWPLPVYSIHILRSRPGVHLHLIADFLADLSLRSMSPPLSSEAVTTQTRPSGACLVTGGKLGQWILSCDHLFHLVNVILILSGLPAQPLLPAVQGSPSLSPTSSVQSTWSSRSNSVWGFFCVVAS